MYEFLKAIFGTNEDGTPKALTFDQFTAALGDAKDITLVNLKDGGYVSKDKFDAKDTELKGVQQQLTDANATIQSYKDMDIEGIKQSVTDWETKYNADTQQLKDQLAAQEMEFAAKTYLGGFKYANDLVRDQIYSKFMEKKFAREGEKFLGADDFMAEMKKQYPTAFVDDTPPADPAPADPPAPATPPAGAPYFAPQTPPAGGQKKRTLSELMKYANEHPGAKITYD